MATLTYLVTFFSRVGEKKVPCKSLLKPICPNVYTVVSDDVSKKGQAGDVFHYLTGAVLMSPVGDQLYLMQFVVVGFDGGNGRKTTASITVLLPCDEGQR